MFNMYFVTCKGKHNTQKKIIYSRSIEEAKEEAQKRLNREFCKYWNMHVTDVEFVKAL